MKSQKSLKLYEVHRIFIWIVHCIWLLFTHNFISRNDDKTFYMSTVLLSKINWLGMKRVRISNSAVAVIQFDWEVHTAQGDGRKYSTRIRRLHMICIINIYFTYVKEERALGNDVFSAESYTVCHYLCWIFATVDVNWCLVYNNKHEINCYCICEMICTVFPPWGCQSSIGHLPN